MRHTAVVLSSNFVSALAVVGVSAVEPGRVEAASTVKSCTGGDVRLSAAENISRDDGRPSPGTTFKAWMRSSSHRSNILDRRLDEVGVRRSYRTHQLLQNTRVDRGSRNPSLIKIPHTRPYC